jgi:DNA-binding PadR family transcriptional regulator
MTETELTILTLVAEGPRYGYEIQQIIDERGLREWLAIGFSSIYYILNKLERQDLLTSELRFSGPGPARKVYQITDAGRGVLQTAISELLRHPRTLGAGFELGLVNLNAMTPRQVYKALSQHQIDLDKRLEIVEKSWDRHQIEDQPIQNHIRALYTHSIAVMQAEKAWLKTFLDDWRERYPAVLTEDDSKSPDSTGSSTPTVHHRRTTPSDPAKMIQRLKPPKKE